MTKLKISCLILLPVLTFAPLVFSQSLPAQIARNMEVREEVSAGDIVSITKEGLKKAKTAYDVSIFGVVVEAPIISTGERTDKTKPIVTSGEAEVKVSAAGGDIKVGDLITSSEKAGVGQKATDPGYVLGKASSDFSGSGEGKVRVMVATSYFQNQSLTSQGLGSLANLGPYSGRYLIAAFLAVLTLLSASFSIVRFVSSGLEAIGRNPLARRSIISGMILSGFVVAILTLAGFGAAAAIITLGR